MIAPTSVLTGLAFVLFPLLGSPPPNQEYGAQEETQEETQQPAEESEPPMPSGISLPEGEAARILAQVRADQLPAGLPEAAATWFEPDCWSRTDTWKAWGALVLAEAEKPGEDPSRRAQLSLLARAQNRSQDAWSHLVALDGKPAWIAAVAPRLFPGIPPSIPLGPGGRPKSIPAGTVLRPLLPPRSPENPAWRIEWRTATYGDLPLEGSTVDFSLMLESTGVQAEFVHKTGDPVRIGIFLPEPEAHQIRVEYVNWSRQETLREPLFVTVAEDNEEPQALYGRLRPKPANFPTPQPGHVPKQMVDGGLWLDLPADDPDREWLAPITDVLTELVGSPVRLGRPDPKVKDALSGSGTVVRLPVGPAREGVLRYLVSSIEQFRLHPAPAADMSEEDTPETGSGD